MTKEELNRRRMMFQINAKRNELLKPEDISTSTVRHSATNDFLAFRKKVAAGMKKQKEQNAEVFNVTAANLQNYQDMLDNNELIHAGTGEFKPTYYQKVENAFGPGKHRYFYTKEEWDAYQNELAGYRKKADDYVKNRDSNNNAGADRAANDSKVANDQKAEKIASNLRNYQSGREAAIKNSNTTVSKEEFERRVAKDKEAQKNPVQKMGNSVKTAVKDLVKAEAIKSDTDRWNKYDQDIRDSIVKSDPTYSNIKTQSDFVKAAKEAGGVDKFYDDLEAKIKKAQGDRDNYNKNAEAAKNAGDDRASKEAPAQKESKVSKEYQEEKEYNTTGKTLAKDLSSAFSDTLNNNEVKGKISDKIGSAAENAGADRGTKEKENAEKDVKKSPKTLANDYTTDNASYKAMVSKVAKAIENGEVIMVGDAPRPVMDSNFKISQSGQAAYDAWAKVMKEVNDAAGNTENYSEFKGQILSNLKKDLNAAKEKETKHDGLEDGITTDAMTPEQEYLEFRKKVEAGLKHFGLNRNLMSVPKNQALADGDSMSHAGMYKYYNKIELPSGEIRYFYTKEEWDAYNKNADAAKNTGADRATKEKENASEIAKMNRVEKELHDRSVKHIQKDIKKYSEISRKDPKKAAKQIIADQGLTTGFVIALADSFIKPGMVSYKDGKFESDSDGAIKMIDHYYNELKEYIGKMPNASEVQEEFDKLLKDEFEKLTNKD